MVAVWADSAVEVEVEVEVDGRDCTGRLPGGLPEPGQQARKGPCIRTIPACVEAICLRQIAHRAEDANFAIFKIPAASIAERTAPGTTCAVSTRESSPIGAVRDLIASVGSLSIIIIISKEEDASRAADDDGKGEENSNNNKEEARTPWRTMTTTIQTEAPGQPHPRHQEPPAHPPLLSASI